MNLELNKVYSGFKLIKEEEAKDVNSLARVFEHEKSGARLLSLFNDDDDKVFSITFRTPPEDSTGVAHILEHSVLCGSRKFPIKEPFVELIKGSLNTFLNAMTFSDKTMYPIASKNDKDFFNLMDVYLDAVLYPNIYDTPEILMQEGWHYHLENKEEPLTYKGVVYNEMKGAFSSPEGVLHRKIQESLLKDTIYSNESGGDPEYVPDLTQEYFIGFHKKYYHPSNSYIFLYGNGDLLEQLAFINDKYLKDFDKINVNSTIEEQKAFTKMETVVEEYPISNEDSEENKAFLSLNFVTGKSEDRELTLAMDILEYMLLETPSAPLKKALIDANLGADAYGSFDDSIVQPTFSIVVKNSEESKAEEFKNIVFETLSKLVKEGIDKELIEASININEFRLREADLGGLSKGLLYAMHSMKSWLYDKDPFIYLEYEKHLEKIKEALSTDYFEKLIEKYLLNNNHGSLLILKPKKGLAEEKAKALQDKLDKYKASLSEKEIDEIVENTQKLLKRQTTPDSEKALETIPLLTLEDIDKEPEKIPQEIKEISETKVLHHNIFTSGIMYMNMLFDASVIEQELVPYAATLAQILGKINTKNKEYGNLSNEVNIHTGGIRYSLESYTDVNDDNIFTPKFVIKSKVLPEKFDKLVELLNEIIHETEFKDGKRVKELLQEIKSRIEMNIFGRGHVVAATRTMSYFSKASNYTENVSGVSFYKFVCSLIKNFDTDKDTILDNLKKVSDKIFNRNNLIISITCDSSEYEIFEKNVEGLVSKLSNENNEPKEYNFEIKQCNEGLKTSGDVQYVAKGYNYKKLGMDYSGKLLVLKTVTSLDYLWNKVRVQGGAYGCMAVMTKSGSLVFTSYRDPNLKETLKAYNDASEYVENIDISDREMRKYIIGTISELDSPLSPALKGERATGDYIRNISYEDTKKEREEVLGTTQKDIKDLACIYRKVMSEDYLCVLGNETKIDENKDVFNETMTVFE